MCVKSVDEFANECVAHSVSRVRLLIKNESRGPGDQKNAMHRIERKYGLPFNVQWRLLYRKPKDIFVSELVRIERAFLKLSQIEGQRLENSIQITAAILGADNPSSLAAVAGVALLAKSNGE